MKSNIDNQGRFIRLIIAIILLIYAIWAKSWFAGAASLFVFYEAFAGWCLFYQLIGKNSCPANTKKSEEKDSK